MRPSNLLAWLAAGVAAVFFLLWALPMAAPFEPEAWAVSRDDAEAIGVELARDLGDLPESTFVVVNRAASFLLQYRLAELVEQGESVAAVRRSRLFSRLHHWRVTIYDSTATGGSWAYQARISPTGRLLQLERSIDDDEAAAALDAATARDRAERFLREVGADIEGVEPEVRLTELENRADTTLRYYDDERLLGDTIQYGTEVKFAGDQLLGFAGFFDDPAEDALLGRLQSVNLWQVAWIYLAMLILPFVAVPFIRRYHAGEVGVRRGLQIGAVMAAAGLLCALFTARGLTTSIGLGALTKPLTAVMIVFLFSISFYGPMAIAGFLSWSAGESISRKHWSRKLAGFDALFRGQWRNATFARASLRGAVSGLLILCASLSVVLLRPRGVVALGVGGGLPEWSSSQWWVVPIVGFALIYALYNALFGHLFLVPWSAGLLRRWGRWVGPLIVLIVSTMLFFPPAILVPMPWTFVLSFVFYGLAIGVFLRYGIFASFLALFVAHSLPVALLLAGRGHPSIQLNAALVIVAAALPVLLSCRYLFSDREFVYRYQDIPPHVRRIAERERQKVELETARGIQSSILPDLPAQLHGVHLSHCYLPASEVGGDFYDVLALDDGRLAVAVGDVAGHGVSSGLVMSMAKSALAVQVTFDPEVESVFRTLNKMVFQSARRRLLTTLCYALIDPKRLEMCFASAGHLFPYRVTRGGTVEALESISYPLGVRSTIDIRARTAKLEPGDKLFLYSDGVVESTPEGSVEAFGFDRLEESLKRHAARDVEGLRIGVLDDLDLFVGSRPRDDDLTVLVLQMPEAVGA